MRSDAARLSDMLAAAAKIEEQITGEFEAFAGEELLQVWVVHHLQIIGEAARNVSQALMDRHPECLGRKSSRSATFSYTSTSG